METNFKLTPNLVVGVVITLLGTVLVLDRLGLLEFQRALRLWPVMLVFFGIAVIVDSARSPADTAAARRPIISPGLVFFLVIATVFLSRAEQGRFMSATTGDSEMSLVGIMGRDDRVVPAQPFRRAQMTTVMGRTSLDLRQAVLAPGTEATIEVFGMMGGVEISVPKHWVVDLRTVVVMGGANDRRRSGSTSADKDALAAQASDRAAGAQSGSAPAVGSAGAAPPAADGSAASAGAPDAAADGSNAPRLIINGFVLMGGVVVKS